MILAGKAEPDAYKRRQAVTAERVLAAILDVAHTRPHPRGDSGLLLRLEPQRLFARGHMTVTPELRFQVNRCIREVPRIGTNTARYTGSG